MWEDGVFQLPKLRLLYRVRVTLMPYRLYQFGKFSVDPVARFGFFCRDADRVRLVFSTDIEREVVLRRGRNWLFFGLNDFVSWVFFSLLIIGYLESAGNLDGCYFRQNALWSVLILAPEGEVLLRLEKLFVKFTGHFEFLVAKSGLPL